MGCFRHQLVVPKASIQGGIFHDAYILVQNGMGTKGDGTGRFSYTRGTRKEKLPSQIDQTNERRGHIVFDSRLFRQFFKGLFGVGIKQEITAQREQSLQFVGNRLRLSIGIGTREQPIAIAINGIFQGLLQRFGSLVINDGTKGRGHDCLNLDQICVICDLERA